VLGWIQVYELICPHLRGLCQTVCTSLAPGWVTDISPLEIHGEGKCQGFPGEKKNNQLYLSQEAIWPVGKGSSLQSELCGFSVRPFRKISCWVAW
jgi:hypothetical protein